MRREVVAGSWGDNGKETNKGIKRTDERKMFEGKIHLHSNREREKAKKGNLEGKVKKRR